MLSVRAHLNQRTTFSSNVQLLEPSGSPHWGLEFRNITSRIAQTSSNLSWTLHLHFAQRDTELISSTMAFALDEIWFLRNHATFQEGHIDITTSCSRIHRRTAEFSSISHFEHSFPLKPPPKAWSPPPQGTIKVNVDAAVTDLSNALRVVAGDHNAIPVKVWAKKYCICPPLQAEC